LGVLAGEAAFLASGRDGVMLHPTMIYGAAGEDNVRRLAALLRRLPVVPLPGGGRALVQPIYQDDVTRCVVAALGRAWAGPRSMVIAGPVAVSYAAFVQAVARAAGLGRVRIVAVPGWVVMAGSFVTRLPGFPKVGVGEVRRLMEDKGFDVGDMREVLGVEPVGLAVGLARSFG
jgi:nucleoside-diphosphate-sugar epimerase